MESCSSSDGAAVAQAHYFLRGYQAKAYSDVVVKCFDKEYELHKIVIDQSEYFRSMLSMNWSCGEEDEEGRLKLSILCDDPSVTPRGVDAVIRSMYCLEIDLNPDMYVPALAAAIFLQFTAFIEKYTCDAETIAKGYRTNKLWQYTCICVRSRARERCGCMY